MPKINNTELYPVKGGGSPGDATAIGTDWKDNGKTKNLPIDEGGEGSINQDNMFRYVRRTITIRSNNGKYDTGDRESEILYELNRSLNVLLSEFDPSADTATPGLFVNDRQLVVFLVKINEVDISPVLQEVSNPPRSGYRKYLFPHLKGKGLYTVGDFTAEDLELVYYDYALRPVLPGDLTGYRDVVFDLGDISGVPLIQFLNEYANADYPNGYPLIDAEKDYYFFFSSEGVDYIYYFDALRASSGYGYYGIDGDELFSSGDLLLFYNGSEVEPVRSKYDWVPERVQVVTSDLVWDFPPMERGEARILELVDKAGDPDPNGSIWVGGYSGVSCGHNTIIRCLITSEGGSFGDEGYKFFIQNSKKQTGIFYYGGGVPRPVTGEPGVLYYNTDTKITYVWNSDANDYDPIGSAIEGEYINATTFNDLNGDPVVPDGDNLYIDVVDVPEVVYRWNGSSFVPLGVYSTIGAEWGSISGDINSQADLISMLAGKANALHTHTWSDITNPLTIPTDINELNDASNLLFSGDYNDLSNTPTIPAAQVNSDWNAISGVEEILNKPTIPTDVNELADTDGLLANFSHITGNNIPRKDMGENMLVDSKLSETEVGVLVDGRTDTDLVVEKAVNATAATTYAIDLTNPSGHYDLTLTDNTSISFSNMIGTNQSTVITLVVRGNYSLLFPSWLKPMPNNDSYYSNSASDVNLITILIRNGGGSPQGMYSLTNVSIA